MASRAATSLFVPAADGLKIHARCHGERNERAAVVCLPGLTRTVADFEPLAAALAADAARPRRVIAIDSRGRGRSDYDPNPANYSVPMELADVLAVTTALAAVPAVFIGTSRGGILTMLLAAVQPAAVAGAVLNDIGPVIERDGLLRIKSYAGKLPQPKSFDDAAEILRGLFGAQFPKLTPAEWLANAQSTFKQENGGLVPNYDVAIATTLEAINFDEPPPALWEQFDALAGKPAMVVRGANSDILSAATVAAMRAHHPTIEVVEVPDQGHAPLLTDPGIIRRIRDFVAGI